MEAEHNDGKPKIGMEFTEEQMAFNFYNTYAGKKGFSVRVEYRNMDRTVQNSRVITNSRYVCYKAGYKRPDKRDYKCRNPRPEVRVGCSARLGVRLNRNSGKYTIYEFVEEHNHELAPLHTRHILKSQRNVLDAQADQIDIAVHSLIGLGVAFELLDRQEHNDGKPKIGMEFTEEHNDGKPKIGMEFTEEHNDGKPKIGMEFTEEQMAFNYYNAYAGKEGFSIRVDYRNMDRTVSSRVITNSRFACYKARFKRPDKHDHKCQNPDSEVRVGCSARLGVRLNRDLGKYTVYEFNEEHNHELAPLQSHHMHKSRRKVSDVQPELGREVSDTPTKPWRKVSDTQTEQIGIAADPGIGIGSGVSFEPLDCQEHKDGKPMIGMEFAEEIMVFNFYNTYAEKEGFSIRVDYRNTDKTVKSSRVITNCRYVCYKEGYKRLDKRGYKCRISGSEVRVGCLARLGVRLNRDLGKYIIYEFNEEHNHELDPLQSRHMLKSKRKGPDAQPEQIDIAVDSVISLEIKKLFED